jgi:hypothetical protein
MERTRLRLETLEMRALLSSMALESEPNNAKPTADEVSFDAADGGADVVGAIGVRQDQDFFHFRATAAGSVDLASETAGGFNTKITVEDGLGRKLLETEPNNGINSGSFAVQTGQDVFIRVRGNRNAAGDYTVHLTLDDSGTAIASRSGTRAEDSPHRSGDDHSGLDDRGHHRRGLGRGRGHGRGHDDGVAPAAVLAHVVGDSANAIIESEPNDRKDMADAFDLGADGQAQLQGAASGHRDRDFFRFTGSTSGTLSVAVESTGGPTAKLQIEDAFGNKMIETEPNNGVNSGSFQVTAGTSYFIRLRSPNAAPAAYLVDLALA